MVQAALDRAERFRGGFAVTWLADPRYAITVLVILLTFVIDMTFHFFRTNLDHEMVILVMTTFNGGGFIAAIGYALGSSSGSKDKDKDREALTQQLIAHLAAKAGMP